MTQQTVERIDEGVQQAVTVFAGLTVLISALVVTNTLGVLVAQRTREFGLLRLVGASRAQVLRTVMGESLGVGLVGAVLGFGIALTPSLLPRPWLFEGIIAGLGAAIGYGVGTFFSWLLRGPLKMIEPTAQIKHRSWIGLAIVGPLLLLLSLVQGTAAQNQVRTLVGMPDEGLSTGVIVAAVALPTFAVAWFISRLLRRFNGWVGRGLDRILPTWLAFTLSVVLIVLVIVGLTTNVICNGFVALMNNIYDGTNASTRPGITQPVAAERTGSSTSCTRRARP